MSGPFKIVALWCWYRGAAFRGYQQQTGHRTVQGELLRAFAEAGLSRNPVVAGRTDKGVSARMQVLSARLERERSPAELVPLLNAKLPDDLRMHLVREVPARFHAAWSASSKEYRYRLRFDEAGDLARLAEVAAMVPGTRAIHCRQGAWLGRYDLGQAKISTSDPTPSASAVQFTVCRWAASVPSCEKKFAGIFGIVSPRKSLSCCIAMITAIPLVNPVTIETGM
jgi:tRNA U38,U39,U40 pseudouridine synthase TruA